MMAANEAVHEGYGGISRISRVCGLSRGTITKGIRELGEKPIAAGRIRRAGGGRHTLLVSDPELPRALETLVEPLARGDPQSPLRWTCKSTRTLAAVTVNHQMWIPGIEPPYVVGIVEIEEQASVRLTTNIIECAEADLKIGMALEVEFEEWEDVFLPMFRPVRAAKKAQAGER